MIIKKELKDPNKIKMKQVAEEPADGGGRRPSRVQQILNSVATAPFRPFSPTSLAANFPSLTPSPTPLMDSISDKFPLSGDFMKRRNDDRVDQIIKAHEANLRHALGGLLSEHNRAAHNAAEERAKKKMREIVPDLQEVLIKNVGLKDMAAHYRAERDKVRDRVEYLEEVTKILQSRLQKAVKSRRYAETPHDEAESSYTDAEEDRTPVRPVKLECRVCAERAATVMMWPCRHVCVCALCNYTTEECPVCGSIKRTSVELLLPS